jgi:hypothetical protein
MDSNYDSDYDSDSDIEIDTSTFTDDNPYFMEFKSNVKDWLALDDDIKKLQEAISGRKKMKNELTPKILEFMSHNKINDLNTSDGKIKYTKSVRTKPLNKDYLINKLGDFFKDLNRGQKAASYLLDNREKSETFRLARVAERKKKS